MKINYEGNGCMTLIVLAYLGLVLAKVVGWVDISWHWIATPMYLVFILIVIVGISFLLAALADWWDKVAYRIGKVDD